MTEPVGGFPRRFLRSGGWIVVTGLAVTTALLVVWAVRLLRTHGPAVGDGRHVSTYGFTLEPSLIPAGEIVASGMPKDGLPTLDAPRLWRLADVARSDADRYAKWLVPSDRVIGLELNGEARAYPLRFLVWHEVVNDTLGGRPILVTYDPLCDSSAVFRRTVAGEVLTFGVSGLLYNSNLLMYDRRPDSKGESLWSQLRMAAVTGPAAAAGRRLDLVTFEVTSWSAWSSAHPGTTLPAPDPRFAARYGSNPYGNYLGSDELRFPARPLPPPSRYPKKTPSVVVLRGARAYAFPYPFVAAQADRAGDWTAEVGGARVRFHYRLRSDTVTVTGTDGQPLSVVYAFTFAWFAAHPTDTVWPWTVGSPEKTGSVPRAPDPFSRHASGRLAQPSSPAGGWVSRAGREP